MAGVIVLTVLFNVSNHHISQDFYLQTVMLQTVMIQYRKTVILRYMMTPVRDIFLAQVQFFFVIRLRKELVPIVYRKSSDHRQKYTQFLTMGSR